MFYKKICTGMLLCCLLISGCGNGNEGNNTESQSVELFMTKDDSSAAETEESLDHEESSAMEESPSGTESAAETEDTGNTVEGTSAGVGEVGTTANDSVPVETEESTAETPAATTQAQDGSYRSELFEFSVIIGKTEYTLPEDFQTFSKMEWNYDGNKELELNPNEYIADEAIYKGNHLVYVSFVNLGYDKVTIKNSKVGSILFDKIALKDANTNIVLAGDIKYGTSSLEDVLKAYGEPDSQESDDNETVLTYGESEYSKVVITINKKKNVITDILMMNYTAPEQNLEISDETPEVVSSYVAPEKMGTNLQKPLFYYDGKYYRLPAPVKAFIDNGWSYESEVYDAVAAGSTCNMYLTKGDYSIKVQVTNYTSEVQYLKNCFVTWIEAGKADGSTDVEMILPGKIKTGMTEEEMLTALGNVSYTKDESDAVYDIYTVAYENNTGKIRLYVMKETDVLWRIVAKNQPDKID